MNFDLHVLREMLSGNMENQFELCRVRPVQARVAATRGTRWISQPRCRRPEESLKIARYSLNGPILKQTFMYENCQFSFGNIKENLFSNTAPQHRFARQQLAAAYPVYPLTPVVAPETEN